MEVKWRKMLEFYNRRDINFNKKQLKCVFPRVMAAIGISKRTLERIKNETTLKKKQEFLSQHRESHGRRRIIILLKL
jgi:hypothetical protein